MRRERVLLGLGKCLLKLEPYNYRYQKIVTYHCRTSSVTFLPRDATPDSIAMGTTLGMRINLGESARSAEGAL